MFVEASGNEPAYYYAQYISLDRAGVQSADVILPNVTPLGLKPKTRWVKTICLLPVCYRGV